MELKDIVDYGIFSPAIDETYFPNTSYLSYWSSTTSVPSADSAWSVHFHSGGVFFYDESNGYHVRCVRGEQTTADFTDNGNGTVTDNNTSLMWQQEDDDTERIWESAITYCEDLSLAGKNDWRMPNSKELMSIVNLNEYSPAINTTYFPNTNFWFYWSSTTHVFNTSYALYVEFIGGGVAPYLKSSWSAYVRCVRGGQ